MDNIKKLVISDIKHLFANVVSCIITIGLIVLPSVFAWFNILACWDVFGNTDKIAFAVANDDEGYQSDLIPIRVNIGEEVLSALRKNGEIDWRFMDADAAIDAAKSGECYAAIVIPKTFSRDMLTFYTEDSEHADIVYYSNEKKNPISPKVTSIGADTISYDVNQVFAKTLSEIALSLADSISTYSDKVDAEGVIADLAQHMLDTADDMERTCSVIGLYVDLMGISKQIVSDCAGMVGTAHEQLDSAFGDAQEGIAATGQMMDAVSSSAALMESALDSSMRTFDEVSNTVDGAFDTAMASAGSAASDLRSQAGSLGSLRGDLSTLAARLDSIAGQVPSQYAGAVQAAANRMRDASALVGQMQDSLNAAADSLDAGIADASASQEEVKRLAGEAKANIESVQRDYDETIKPGIQKLADEATGFADRILASKGSLDSASSSLQGSADSIGGVFSSAEGKLSDIDESLTEAAEKVRNVGLELKAALASGDREALKRLLESDVNEFAQALSAPVGIERHAVFASKDFGSAMTPFYSTLGLFVGSLLILVAVKPNVSGRAQRKLDDPKPHELFWGRFGVMAFLSLAQTTVLGLGDILYLQVQVLNPVLMMIAIWFTGLVFVFLIYSLVASLANIGKSLAVILLVIQITGCSGSYPLEILPWFVRELSPWLPATHAVDAMRAAMFGIYHNDYLVQMGELALFIIPALVVGLVLREPLQRFTRIFVEKVESTEIIA